MILPGGREAEAHNHPAVVNPEGGEQMAAVKPCAGNVVVEVGDWPIGAVLPEQAKANTGSY